MFWYKLSKGMRNPWKVLEHIVEYKGGAEGTNVTWTSFLSYQADAELERAPTPPHPEDLPTRLTPLDP